jgi:hypothetical protein
MEIVTKSKDFSVSQIRLYFLEIIQEENNRNIGVFDSYINSTLNSEPKKILLFEEKYFLSNTFMYSQSDILFFKPI